jgi:dTDP-4-dehydrorhamnose reductase
MNLNNKILVLGASGMLGSMVYKYLSDDSDLCVYGTYRNIEVKNYFKNDLRERLLYVDASSEIQLRLLIESVKPKVIINCIGLVKQLNLDALILEAININARLPHVLQKISNEHHCRLIQFSTDCVFSGTKGMYSESDLIDAHDIYGITKFLGEISQSRNTLTIRTSIIGPELNAGQDRKSVV